MRLNRCVSTGICWCITSRKCLWCVRLFIFQVLFLTYPGCCTDILDLVRGRWTAQQETVFRRLWRTWERPCQVLTVWRKAKTISSRTGWRTYWIYLYVQIGLCLLWSWEESIWVLWCSRHRKLMFPKCSEWRGCDHFDGFQYGVIFKNFHCDFICLVKIFRLKWPNVYVRLFIYFSNVSSV